MSNTSDLHNRFYDIPREFRAVDNPYNLGGRDTDFESIGFTLVNVVKDNFPVNQAPPELVTKADDFLRKARELEALYWEIIVEVSERNMAYVRPETEKEMAYTRTQQIEQAAIALVKSYLPWDGFTRVHSGPFKELVQALDRPVGKGENDDSQGSTEEQHLLDR